MILELRRFFVASFLFLSERQVQHVERSLDLKIDPDYSVGMGDINTG